MAGDLTDPRRSPLAVRVTNPADPRVDDYRDLRAHGRSASTPTPGTILVEGHVAVRRLLASGLTVRSVLVSDRGLRLLADDLAGVEAPVLVAEPAVLAAIVGFDLHRGALAAAVRPPPLSVPAVLEAARVAVALEGVNDAENVGALARSAVALGVDAMLLAPGCADPLYRRAVRVSMGHVLSLPTATLAPWPDALADLRGDGWLVAALTPAPGAEPLSRLVAEDPDRVVLVAGAEGAGLSPAALAAADRRVRIPMVAGVDSLNVATAAAIAFAHLGRAGRGS